MWSPGATMPRRRSGCETPVGPETPGNDSAVVVDVDATTRPCATMRTTILVTLKHWRDVGITVHIEAGEV